jgi:hypothetical protein
VTAARDVYDAIEPTLDEIMDDIQGSDLSPLEMREVITLISVYVFAMGVGVTEDIEGSSRDSDPTAHDLRRFADHVIDEFSKDVPTS